LDPISRALAGHSTRATTGLANPAQWFVDALSSGATNASGIKITKTTALTISAVYRAVTLRCETLQVVPMLVYERLPERGKRVADNHYLYDLIHRRPHPQMTPGRWRKLMEAHRLLWGNGFCEIERKRIGKQPIALHPIHPSRCEPDLDIAGNWSGRWEVSEGPGGGGEKRYINDSDMFHVMAYSDDGFTGQSVVTYARNSLGLAAAAERHGASTFSQGAVPQHVVKYSQPLRSKAEQDDFKERWYKEYKGPTKQGKTAVLPEGVEITQVGMSNEDAQFLGTREFSVLEVARWFGVPPHKLSHLADATFSNVEHMRMEFYSDTMLPTLHEYEEECTLKLLKESEQRRYFVESKADAILRADTKTRYEAYSMGINSGTVTRNEVRSMENLNPIEGLDRPLAPLNMGYVDENGDVINPNATSYSEPPSEPIVPDDEVQDDDNNREAFRIMWSDAAGRMVAREVQQIRRIVRKSETVDEVRDGITEWYAKHSDAVRLAFGPVHRAHCAANGKDCDVDSLVERYVSSSLGQLRGVLDDVDESDAKQAVLDRLDDWSDGRADAIAEGFIEC
jgi:HK97 family phage portal protein